ncbi:phosphatase PAP2 family protein [Novosphingobium hassiacum]|uniref:phosphatase PAP2 family protein n=1 Tax=Novosphingobium hassiacum TaxID=173676 RepID=UPI00161FE267|nr:phosphatase PAP2 family protein [Novosphingobium hassiacum]
MRGLHRKKTGSASAGCRQVKCFLIMKGYPLGMPPIAVHAAPPVVCVTRGEGGSARAQSFQASWLVIACGFLVALLTLKVTGMGILVTSVAPLVCFAVALVGVQAYYTRYRFDERIVATCGILAILISACLLAAIISHASLRLRAPQIDGALDGADLALGLYAPAIVLKLSKYPAFAALLGVIYSSAMPVCVITALALAASGRRARACEFAFSFTFCILLAATVSAGFPALGSTVYHGMESTAGLPSQAGTFHMATVEYFRNDPSAIFDLAKVQGIVTFPSFHMVMAILLPYALRGETRIGIWIAVIWSLLVALSSVVIGGHYVIDLLAGAATWAASAWLIRSAGRDPDRAR